jgi:hypothetical protein
MIAELPIGENINFVGRPMDKTMTRGLAFVAGLWLMGVADVQAQDLPRVFVNVNFGAQSHTHTISSSSAFTIYAEPATFSSSQSVSGGLLVDVGVGYRMLNTLAIAISGSRISDVSEAAVEATIPHPTFFDRPKTTTTTIDGLDRREVGIHVQAMWFLPVSGFLPGARLAFTAGPSFFTVRQDLVPGASAAIVQPRTQDLVSPLPVTTEKKSSVGVNVGFDFAYEIVPRIGVGAFVRYAGSSFDFDTVTGEKAGGLQGGGGLRLGF